MVIQAVSYDEIVAWCRTFLKVKPAKVLKLSKLTRKAVEDRIQRHISYIPEAVSTSYHAKLSIWGNTGLKLEQLLQFAYCQRPPEEATHPPCRPRFAALT
jgi:hypothetical protein